MSEHKYNLLIVEDDPDDQLLLKEVIEEYKPSYALTIVQDGNRFIQYLKNETIPDLVLLDLNIPFKNGLECLVELRADSRFAHLPVIIFSTSSYLQEIEQGFKNGAHLFITKPLTFPNFKKIVQFMLDIQWEKFPKLTKAEFVQIAYDSSLVDSISSFNFKTDFDKNYPGLLRGENAN